MAVGQAPVEIPVGADDQLLDVRIDAVALDRGRDLATDARDLLVGGPVPGLRRAKPVDDQHGDPVGARVAVPGLADERVAVRRETAVVGGADEVVPAQRVPSAFSQTGGTPARRAFQSATTVAQLTST